jgi:hypothetical protein
MTILQRCAALTGADYVVLANVGNAMSTDAGPRPNPDQPPGQQDIAYMHWLAGSTSGQRGVTLELLAFAALMLFVGYLCRGSGRAVGSRSRRADRRRGLDRGEARVRGAATDGVRPARLAQSRSRAGAHRHEQRRRQHTPGRDIYTELCSSGRGALTLNDWLAVTGSSHGSCASPAASSPRPSATTSSTRSPSRGVPGSSQTRTRASRSRTRSASTSSSTTTALVSIGD